MKWSRAVVLAACAMIGASQAALAQSGPTQCNAFVPLREAAQKQALAVRNATEHKAERKEVCSLVKVFSAAEEEVVKFLETNKTWCGVPEQAIKEAKQAHERTLKFKTAACSDAPVAQPKAPTLSDAIATPSVDSPTNTRTGRGTLDTLSGNPLAK